MFLSCAKCIIQIVWCYYFGVPGVLRTYSVIIITNKNYIYQHIEVVAHWLPHEIFKIVFLDVNAGMFKKI